MSRAVLPLVFILFAGCAREPDPPRAAPAPPAAASDTAAPPKSERAARTDKSESAAPAGISESAAAAGTSESAAPAGKSEPAAPPGSSETALPPVSPPAPGTPGGLPDDRTPVSEAPFTPTSAQGAANVVQTYYALLGEHRYADAWKLWSQGGAGSGMTAKDFEESFAQYESYNANIGAPGQIEGAAGSLYVSVPVVIYGRKKSGEEVHELGEVTLRRVNDVPGSTLEQRAWHLFKIDLRYTR